MREQELAVPGPTVELSGTLALPEGAGPFAAAVLVSGSGPLDRDGNVRRGRFDVSRQLAAALAAAGIASLRYDKRGVGRTPGDWRAAGFFDNRDDAAAAVATLRARPEVRPDAVFLVGHSEGAILAAALLGQGAPVAGAVLLSGTARPGEDLLRWQAARIVPTLPAPVRAVLRLLRVDPVAKVAANHARLKATTTDVARIGGARVNARWAREFIAYDPSHDLAGAAVPVLAVTGSKDLQTPPEDLDRIRDLCGAETHLVPDMTHTLRRQPGPPSLSRYKQELREPVDAEVIALVTGWVARVAGVSPAPAGVTD